MLDTDALFWRKAPPTEDGYYWHREDISYEAVIRYVFRGLVKHGIDVRGEVASYGGEWYGPLQEPGGGAIENCRGRTE